MTPITLWIIFYIFRSHLVQNLSISQITVNYSQKKKLFLEIPVGNYFERTTPKRNLVPGNLCGNVQRHHLFGVNFTVRMGDMQSSDLSITPYCLLTVYTSWCFEGNFSCQMRVNCQSKK